MDEDGFLCPHVVHLMKKMKRMGGWFVFCQPCPISLCHSLPVTLSTVPSARNTQQSLKDKKRKGKKLHQCVCSGFYCSVKNVCPWPWRHWVRFLDPAKAICGLGLGCSRYTAQKIVTFLSILNHHVASTSSCILLLHNINTSRL